MSLWLDLRVQSELKGDALPVFFFYVTEATEERNISDVRPSKRGSICMRRRMCSGGLFLLVERAAFSSLWAGASLFAMRQESVRSVRREGFSGHYFRRRSLCRTSKMTNFF